MADVRPEELQAVDWLAQLPGEVLGVLAADATVRAFRAGDVIFKEGDSCDGLPIIRTGKVKIVRIDPDESELVFQVYEDGDSFGARAPIGNSPRTASAIAVEDTEAIWVGMPALERLVFEDASILRRTLAGVMDSVFREKEDTVVALYDSRLELIYRLALAAEQNDDDTGAHIWRMASFCARLGRAVGMSKAEADVLFNAAMMHDIGKLGIPESILAKPGKFTDDDYAIMKKHPMIAHEILGGRTKSEFILLAEKIAIAHHEKWAGGGYPRGISKEDIPLGARIAAVCDVFDALTSRRPYKEPMPVEKALDILQRDAGTHFDPDLVTLFIGVLPDILQLKEQYAHPPRLEDD